MQIIAGDLQALLDADLSSNGWHGGLSPYPGEQTKQYAMSALSRSFLKKFHNNETSEERDSAALTLFLKINEGCRTWQPHNYSTTLEAVAGGEARDFLYRFFHLNREWGDESLLSTSRIAQGLAFGRGANIGAKSGDPYGKLAISRLTYSDPALLVLFQHTWCAYELEREQELFRAANFPTSQVQGSKLSFVPKSNKISRTICTEPILNMFFQKGIAAVLERRLKQVVGIDLSKQPDKNRELARIGSLTGEFGTIDLSSASDSMSRALVADMFPPVLVDWLERTRCKQTTLPGGDVLDLHMISSMGNAFTFPLQTIFFTSVVVGAYKALGIKPEFPFRRALGNLAVFGDDIIVRHEAYNLVVRMLEHYGFAVNNDKSFNSGLFRESCGSDWLAGHNVRGVYLQTLLDDQDCYSAFNRLSYWSDRQGIDLTWTLDYLKRAVSKPLYVPLHEDDEAGFKVSLSDARAYTTWHKDYQAFRYLAAVRRNLDVEIPTVHDPLVASSAKERREATKFLRRIGRVIPGWKYSPSGLMLLMLHGNIRDGRLTLRTECRDTEYRKRVTSCWNSRVTAGPVKVQRDYYLRGDPTLRRIV